MKFKNTLFTLSLLFIAGSLLGQDGILTVSKISPNGSTPTATFRQTDVDTNPVRIQFQNASNTGKYFAFSAKPTDVTPIFNINYDNGPTNTSIFTILGDDQYIGIRNTNPERVLDVGGSGRFIHNGGAEFPTLELIEETNNDFTRLFFKNDNNATDKWALSANLGTTSDKTFGFYFNNNPRMVFNETTGGLGIGTTTPEARLDVRGGNALFSDGIGIGSTTLPQSDEGIRVEGKSDALAIWNGSLNSGISWYNTAGGASATPRATITYAPINDQRLELRTYGSGGDIEFKASDDIVFMSGTTTLTTNMFLRDDGDLGLGTGNPGGKMEIAHNSNSDDPQLILHESEDDFARLFYTSTADPDTYWSAVGTPSPSAPRYLIGYNDGTTSSAAVKLEVNDDGVIVMGDLEYTGTLTPPSDRRLKQNIEDLDGISMLEKVMQLRPTTYQFDTKKYDYARLAEGKQFGFISQEVEKIFPSLVHHKKHTYNIGEKGSKNATKELEFKALDYMSFIPILTEAIQEQQTEIEQLQATNEVLMNRLSRLEALMGQTEKRTTESILLTNAELKQNTPNPFTENTQISYFIPENVDTAQLQISDMNGKVVKSIIINERGEGQVILQANALSAGNYHYSLIVDGQVLESKQMVLTR